MRYERQFMEEDKMNILFCLRNKNFVAKLVIIITYMIFYEMQDVDQMFISTEVSLSGNTF